jgi:hypothetical protein
MIFDCPQLVSVCVQLGRVQVQLAGVRVQLDSTRVQSNSPRRLLACVPMLVANYLAANSNRPLLQAVLTWRGAGPSNSALQTLPGGV